MPTQCSMASGTKKESVIRHLWLREVVPVACLCIAHTRPHDAQIDFQRKSELSNSEHHADFVHCLHSRKNNKKGEQIQNVNTLHFKVHTKQHTVSQSSLFKCVQFCIREPTIHRAMGKVRRHNVPSSCGISDSNENLFQWVNAHDELMHFVIP